MRLRALKLKVTGRKTHQVLFAIQREQRVYDDWSEDSKVRNFVQKTVKGHNLYMLTVTDATGFERQTGLHVCMYMYGFRARQHLRSLAPVMNDE